MQETGICGHGPSTHLHVVARDIFMFEEGINGALEHEFTRFIEDNEQIVFQLEGRAQRTAIALYSSLRG